MDMNMRNIAIIITMNMKKRKMDIITIITTIFNFG